MVQLTKISIGLVNGFVPNKRQAIIWTNADPIHWRIYAALGGDGLFASPKITKQTIPQCNVLQSKQSPNTTFYKANKPFTKWYNE